MSIFHSLPPPDELRQLAIDKADQYFEDHNLPNSSLSLVSILLPEKNILRKYPKSTPCHRIYDMDCCDIPSGCSRSYLRDWFECIYGTYYIYFCIIFGCWFNCVILADCFIEGEASTRVDIIRCVYLVYQEGIFIYKAKLKPLKCGYLCFCWDVLEESYDYNIYPEDSYYFPWGVQLIYPRSYERRIKMNKHFTFLQIDKREYVVPTRVGEALLECQKELSMVSEA
eukprot:snap_masked-scaffold_11-processed-gene-8.7-mRNA-1 protein AED:0.32 eAED:1.00 QI:0/-1/0/1/-1/1/1/0/225